MNEQTPNVMTDTELDAFADRIAGWANGLAPAERALWDGMLVRAAAPRAEVTGHVASFGALLALSGGQSADRLGNFEIQRLMSSFNQAETLASSVLRKQQQTSSGIIGKI